MAETRRPEERWQSEGGREGGSGEIGGGMWMEDEKMYRGKEREM